MAAMKAFYSEVFSWRYQDYGPQYAEIIGAAVVKAGGRVTVPIFDFPGGRRFHFADPSGNELAIWTKL